MNRYMNYINSIEKLVEGANAEELERLFTGMSATLNSICNVKMKQLTKVDATDVK